MMFALPIFAVFYSHILQRVSIIYVLHQFELFIENQVSLYKDTIEKSEVRTNNWSFYSFSF